MCKHFELCSNKCFMIRAFVLNSSKKELDDNLGRRRKLRHLKCSSQLARPKTRDNSQLNRRLILRPEAYIFTKSS